MNEPNKGLEQFQSVKTVRAGRITEVVPSGCYVLEADGTKVLRTFSPGMTARFAPAPGDYWVVYEGGYESLSPRLPFLQGYRPL